jgi:hypothetical protein
MTIMFAGGLTIAAPTMFPDTDAQTSSMLSVSTTTLQGGAILEIVVNDPDLVATDQAHASPLVTVDGNIEPVMVQSSNGKWYAYVADKSNVEASEGVSSIGWDWGNALCDLGIGADGTATMLGTETATGITPYVEISVGTALTYTVATATQCLDHGGNTEAPGNIKGQAVDVDKTSGQERDEINMLQGLPGVNLDVGTAIGSITKGNAGMKYNTTDGSVSGWPLIQAWELGGTSTICYAGECIDVDRGITDADISISVNKTAVTDNDHIVLEISDMGLNLDPTFPDEWTFSVTETAGSETTTWRGNMTDSFGGNTALTRANLKTAGFGDGGYLSVTDGGAALGNPSDAVVTVYETGANTGVFTTLMSNDTSDLRTGLHSVADADDVITINYAGNKVNLVVAYTDMSMTLDAGDEWAPGESATLTIVDPDANKVASSTETLATSNEEITIPTITMGSPIWCDDSSARTLDSEATNSATANTTITPSAMKAVDDDSKRCQSTVTASTAAVITWWNTTVGKACSISSGVTSDCDKDATAAENATSATNRAQTWEDSGTVILGFDVTEIADVLESTAAITEIAIYMSTNETSGTRAVGDDSVSQNYITVSEGNVTKKGTVKVTGENKGYTVKNLQTGKPIVVSIKITTTAAASLTADTYATSIDICNFDQDASSAEHDCVYRVEVEETGDDTGVFEGTVAYANMNAKNTDTGAQDYIVQNNQDVIMLIHSGVSGSDAPRVEYNDTSSVFL